MSCAVCISGDQVEFNAEINIHLRGRKNVDHPGILVFPKLSVCLVCGSSQFSIPENELSHLAERAQSHESSTH
jgi:hypothetical protein